MTYLQRLQQLRNYRRLYRNLGRMIGGLAVASDAYTMFWGLVWVANWVLRMG